VTLVWGRVGFGIPLGIAHPVAFAVAIVACVIAIAALGLIVASTFVLYRAAFALGIALQYPVWLASGLLVPLSALPGWLGPVSWTLAPTWGFQAIRRAAVAGNAWPSVAMCFVVSVAYVAIAVVFLRLFEYLARQRASLKLA
jgi:ABC-2 type transport system permease protein